MRLTGPWTRLLTCAALVVALGCADSADDAAPEPAYVLYVQPPTGQAIPDTTEVTVVFDRDPGTVRVTGAKPVPDSPSGSTRVFLPLGGPIQFTWGDGESLTVEYFLMGGETAPATIVSVSPGVDVSAPLDALRADGIVIEFNVPVYAPQGSWELAFEITDADGESWRPSTTVDGNRVTLREPAVGGFVDGHAYTVTGEVIDGQRNATLIRFDVVVGDSPTLEGE